MYKIGLFSKMNRITTKTLRHYDEIGLLKPAHVDDLTGYRYYASEQLPILHKIMTLKQMGLGLTDIQQIVDDPVSVQLFLKLKEKELRDAVEEQEKKLLQIKNYMNRLKGEDMAVYNPVIKTLPKVIVASMRFRSPSYGDYFHMIPKMGEEMKRQGAVCAEPEYCFNIYHDGEYKEKDIDVEVCEAVVDFCQGSEMVQYKVIDQVDTAVCILHKGPYEAFREAYTFIYQWIKDNGYEAIDNPRESYIDGIWNKESKEDWLTEIQVPIRK